MSPLAKYRAGAPVTLLDKARTCKTIEELEGFTSQLKKSPGHVSQSEWEELARMRIAMQ